MTSAIVGFDISRNYTVEVGYVGRFGRDMLVRRDLAMPLNLVRSGVEARTTSPPRSRSSGGAGGGPYQRLGGGRLRRPPGGGRTGRTFSRARRAAA